MVAGAKRSFILDYIRSHWQGEQPLWRSFWINSILLSMPMNRLILWQVDLPSEQRHDCVLLGGCLFGIGLGVWQIVGLWRSARRVRRERISRFWSTAAQAFVVLNLLCMVMFLSLASLTVYAVWLALSDPLDSLPFEIAREGEVVRFNGTIHEASAEKLLAVLEDPRVKQLEVDSPGGRTAAAVAIADRIHAHRIMVRAGDYCMSACILLLAASPGAAVHSYSEILLHHSSSSVPEWIMAILNPDFESGDTFYTKELARYHVTPDAIQKLLALPKDGDWRPGIREMAEMNLIVFVYDAENNKLVRVHEYCKWYAADCE